jgi:hypothetical protein
MRVFVASCAYETEQLLIVCASSFERRATLAPEVYLHTIVRLRSSGAKGETQQHFRIGHVFPVFCRNSKLSGRPKTANDRPIEKQIWQSEKRPL